MPTSRSRPARACGSWSPNATRRIRSMKPSTRRWSMLNFSPSGTGRGRGQGEVGEHPVGERDVAVLADDLQHPGAVALRPRPHGPVADRLLAAARPRRRRRPGSPGAGSGTSSRAGTGSATARPRRRPWPAPAPPPAGPPASSSSAVSWASTSARARSIRPASTAASVSGRTDTSRVASSTSRSAAGFAIPRVTISSWITVLCVSSSSDGTPHSRSTPASSARAAAAQSSANRGHQPQLLHLARGDLPDRGPQPHDPAPRSARSGAGGCAGPIARAPVAVIVVGHAANLRATTDSSADRAGPEPLYPQRILAQTACGQRHGLQSDSGRGPGPSLSTGPHGNGRRPQVSTPLP